MSGAELATLKTGDAAQVKVPGWLKVQARQLASSAPGQWLEYRDEPGKLCRVPDKRPRKLTGEQALEILRLIK